MKLRLQNFDHKSSAYERPTQRWICGRAMTGKPCQIGPGIKGQCRSLTECRPKRTPDGWVCTRSKGAGGVCEQGPSDDGRCCSRLPPCVPVRSLRSRRGRVTAWATVISLAALLILLGSRMHAQLIHPGPVYAGHAEITACESCHARFQGGPAAWFKAALSEADAVVDSEKCLACHKRGTDPLKAHNMPQAELQQITEKFRLDNQASPPWTMQLSRAVFAPPEQVHDGPLACAACHKEHRGESADLNEVSNGRCQTCHEVTFHSFSQGHPPFDDYPYRRRTRIIFDHDSHNRKNFQERAQQGADVPQTCATCHHPDPTGQFMVNASFEETCARCHSEDLSGESVAGPKGTPVIAIPELDLQTIADRGLSVGEWPEVAFAFEISPYTKLLLAADPAIAEDLRLIAETDLQDLSAATDQEIQAVARVAWAIKELLFDLTISGMGILQAKIEASLNNSLDTDTVGRLIGHIPQDVVASAGLFWFPNLKQEVVAYRERKSASLSPNLINGATASDDLLSSDAAPPADQPTDALLAQSELAPNQVPRDPAEENDALGLETLDPEEWAKAGGWYRKDFILYYRPVGHQDVVFRTWLDISTQAFGSPAERFGEDLLTLLSDNNTPGKCLKCHSVDQQPGGRLAVNWGSFAPVAGESSFTAFKHETHFSAINNRGCVACHRLSGQNTYQASYQTRDPLSFRSNFAEVEQTFCAECHVANSAGDDCTMCHEYHIGRFGQDSLSTRMEDLDDARPVPEPAETAPGVDAQNREDGAGSAPQADRQPAGNGITNAELSR